jgi:hypothetical protein
MFSFKSQIHKSYSVASFIGAFSSAGWKLSPLGVTSVCKKFENKTVKYGTTKNFHLKNLSSSRLIIDYLNFYPKTN